MATPKSFRVGKVIGYLRGSIWYLRYVENSRRRQVRGGPDKQAVQQLAAQVNAQLAAGAPAVTSFESITVEEMRKRWLEHHEHVLRSSVATIDRYRTATDHLLAFIRDTQPTKHARNFQPSHAEAFVRYGELAHLLLPDDLDLDKAWLYVRNKPQVGWQVKTRTERKIPLVG